MPEAAACGASPVRIWVAAPNRKASPLGWLFYLELYNTDQTKAQHSGFGLERKKEGA